MDGFACFEHSVFVSALTGFLGECIASYRINGGYCISVLKWLTALEFHFYRIYKASVGNVCLCNFIGCCCCNSFTCRNLLNCENVRSLLRCTFDHNTRKFNDPYGFRFVIDILYIDCKGNSLIQIIGFILMGLGYNLAWIYRIFFTSVCNLQKSCKKNNGIVLCHILCFCLAALSFLACCICKNLQICDLILAFANQCLASFYMCDFLLAICQSSICQFPCRSRKLLAVIFLLAAVSLEGYLASGDFKSSVLHLKHNVCKVRVDVLEIFCLQLHIVDSGICSFYLSISSECEIFVSIQLVTDVCYSVAGNCFLCSVIDFCTTVFFQCYHNLICYRCNKQAAILSFNGVVVSVGIFIQLIGECILAVTYSCLGSCYIIGCAFALDKSIATYRYILCC